MNRQRESFRRWLAWNNGVAVVLMEEALDQRLSLEERQVRLQILADALAEAGCDDATLLLCFRDPRFSAEGFYIVDWFTRRDDYRNADRLPAARSGARA